MKHDMILRRRNITVEWESRCWQFRKIFFRLQ